MTKSSSKKRKKHFPLRGRRPLKRGCSYHQVSGEDYPWLWVAYQKGDFAELQIEPGLTSEEFTVYLDTIIENYYSRDGTIVIFDAYFIEQGSSAPVCVVFVDKSQRAFFPHAFWFSWATPRNKIESAVNFLKDLVKDGNVIIFSERKTLWFFSHMARYGLLNRRGTLKKYFPDGGDAIIFQGRK